MKKATIFLLLFFTTIIVQAQVGINTTIPNAQLDIRSSNQATPTNTDGILIPKVDAFPATNPTAAQQGMLVYLTTTSGADLPGFYYWDNAAVDWIPIGNSKNSWTTTGNSGTNATVNFIGTTDDNDLIFKRNNQKVGIIGNGNFSFGFNNFTSGVTGSANYLFGSACLQNNISGSYNNAFGVLALNNNTTGNSNVALGDFSYFSNTSGGQNVGCGSYSGYGNSTGYGNTSIGRMASYNTSTGNFNTSVGNFTLNTNVTGSGNVAIGSNADVASTNLFNATAIGASAEVGASNSLVLGSINGINGASSSVNVGIGTTTPQDRLHVVGNIRMVDGNQAVGRVLVSDVNGTATWTNPAGITNGTLDQAYDFGGAGLGRTITADAGAVTVNGTDGFVSTGVLFTGATAPAGAGTKMVWNPRKGAFRAGNVFGTEWDNGNIGSFSTAFGENTRATGAYSFSIGYANFASGQASCSFGQSTTASALASVSFGNQTIANGDYSAVFGQQASASGLASFSSGQNTGANAPYSTAFGYWSNSSGESSFVAGRSSSATGYTSICFGENNYALGSNTSALGFNGTAVSFGETVLGIGATTYTASTNGSTQFRVANATDRLFVIGNAIDTNNNSFVDTAERSDAMMILKNGLTRLPSTTNAMITAADGKAVVTKEYLQSNTSGTLDQAYDFGGVGNGRIITADAGALTINGTDGLVSTGTFNSGVIAPAGSGTRLVWNPRKAAIRAGNVFGTEWDNANMGSFSAAFGENTTASGAYSFSMGYANTASGQSSTTFGQSNNALGNYSTAFGYQTTANNLYATSFGYSSQAMNQTATAFGSSTIASGIASTAFGWTNTASGTVSTAFGIANTASSDYSTVFGRQNSAFSYGETVLGIGATIYTPSTNGNSQFRTANATDRLFVIGNAIDSNNNNVVDVAERSDAMVILKNGNTGFGTSTPAVSLEIRKPDPIVRVAADDTNSSFLQLYEMTAGLPYGYMFEYDGNLDKLYLHSKGFTGNDGIRMTWLKTGNVGIGTFNPNGQFELSLDQGRKPGTNTWTIVSDQRLKTINGNYTKGLNEILQLNPIRFNYKNNGERTFEKEVLDTEFAGFIAQEVQPLFPDAVGTDADGFLNFNIHPILIASVNAIKELNAQNESLQEENQQLKQQLESLLAQQKNQESLNKTIVERLAALETKN